MGRVDQLPDPQGRELGPLERWYWLFDKVSPLNGVICCRVEGELDTGSVVAALAALQERHPLLRSKILANEKGERPRFVIDDTLVIPVTRERLEGARREDERWVDYVRASVLNTRLDSESGPLLRVIILDDEDGAVVLFYVSHAIVDATGGMSLMKEFLHAVEGVDQPEPAFPLMPSLSDRFPPREHGVLALLRALYLQVEREVWVFFNRPSRLRADVEVPFAERVTDFVHRKLDKDQTKQLVSVCRANGASVQAALCTSLLLAVAEDIRSRGEAKHDDPLTIGIGSPVTLRSGLVPAADDRELGVFVGTFMTWIKGVGKREFWDMAREFAADLRRQADAGEAFTVLNFARKTMPRSVRTAGGFMKLLDAKGPNNACVSNLGRFDFPEQIGGLTISHAQMLAECSVTGIWVGIVNTCHDQLVWNFCYTKGIFTRERAVGLADRCIQTLLRELSTGRTRGAGPA